MCLEKLSRARVSIMTPDDFRQSLTADKPPAGLSLAVAGLWWNAKAIGRGRTNRRGRTKAKMARGCMPTCIARKAIRATQPIGITGQKSPFAESHWMWNG